VARGKKGVARGSQFKAHPTTKNQMVCAMSAAKTKEKDAQMFSDDGGFEETQKVAENMQRLQDEAKLPAAVIPKPAAKSRALPKPRA
jgi:hypothetical protein